jgi:hypothetical protein
MARIKTPALTPRQRFARGLKYSTVGPVDVTRGALGLSLQSVGSSAGWLRDQYRNGKLREDLEAAQEAIQHTLATELAAAQDIVVSLPETLQKARRGRRRPRPLVLAVAGVGVLAIGAVTFSIVRRSTQPDPSPLPPSVDVTPKP